MTAKLEQHHNWKGGRFIKGGYVCIKNRNHPYCDVRGYVKEHRLVMEVYLGRYLTREEEIHHINGNTQDNRIENLFLFETKGKHTGHHNKIKEERICFKCNSDKTYIHKKGYPVWYKFNTGFLCQKCHDRKKYDVFRKGVKYFG